MFGNCLNKSGFAMGMFLAGVATLATSVTHAAVPYVSPPIQPPTNGAGVNIVDGPRKIGPVKVVEPPADRSASCDATCLQGIAQTYLNALARRNYSGLAVAPNLLAAENMQPSRIGDGVWRVLEKLNLPATFLTDPVQGQVVVLTSIEESAHQPLILIVRLKVEDRKIAEVETMVTGDAEAGQHFAPDHMANFDPATMALLPREQRLTREQLIALADAWWRHDGAGITVDASCHPAENADYRPTFPCMVSTQSGGAQWASYAIRAVRNVVIDADRGLVISYLLSDNTPYLNPDPPDNERTPLFYRQSLTTYKVQIAKFKQGNALIAHHIFMNYQAPGTRALFPR